MVPTNPKDPADLNEISFVRELDDFWMTFASHFFVFAYLLLPLLSNNRSRLNRIIFASVKEKKGTHGITVCADADILVGWSRMCMTKRD